MIGDPFQALGDDHQAQTAGDGIGVLDHLICQLLVILLVQEVNLLVLRNQRSRRGGVLVDEGIQRVLQHLGGECGHLRKVQGKFERGVLAKLLHPAGDGGRFVPHPLQVLRDLHCHRDEPQVVGAGGLSQ